MSATAVVKKTARVPGSEKRTVTEVTLDNSYAEGGEPLTPKELGLRTVDSAVCIAKNLSESETVTVGSIWYDTANQKLRVNDAKTQKEMAGTKDLSKVVVIVTALGK